MEPYESVYAGQFMFMLGYLSAARGLAPAGNSVALLAQNPGDKIVGDVVASWGGVTSIIEFKRREDTVRSEFRKPAKKALLDELNGGKLARSLEVSRRGHFLAFGRLLSEGSADVYVLPYADIKDSSKQDGDPWSMQNFLDRILAGKVGLDRTDFGRYVSFLKAFHANGAAKSSAPQTISSLIVNVDPASRRLTFMVVDLLRFRDLRLDHELRGPTLGR